MDNITLPEGKPDGNQRLWRNTKKVLKAILEVVSFLAALKTLFS